ncbi:MAG: SirB1 family protein [Planctomycetota bacterium]
MSPANIEPSPGAPEAGSSGLPGSEIPVERVLALVRLLGDDDAKICSVAWANLEKLGPAVLPYVEQARRNGNDARVRVQCCRFVQEWFRREALASWVRFSKEGSVPLEEGAFLIARTEYPELDVGRCRAQLDAYAEEVRPRLRDAGSVDEAVRVLTRFLFAELGFRGNAENYYDPDNSYLNRVLEEKKGIPISLSAVFLFVARRLSVPVYGVGFPRHFCLKYRGESGDLFVDAFNGGRLLTVRDCVRFLSSAHLPFLDDCLRAVSDREMLIRMLGNLLRIYCATGDQRRADRIAGMLKLLS